MTIFDLSFLVLFWAVIGVALVGLCTALSGARRAAGITLGSLGVFTAIYLFTWTAAAGLSAQRPLSVGDPRCVDNWCVGVEEVKRYALEMRTRYEVTLCIFSRAERAPTSFRTPKTLDAAKDFRLVDGSGSFYDPLPHQAEVPLDVLLWPGQAVRTKRTFEVPPNVSGLGVVIGQKSLGVCPMIGECSSSHRAGDFVIASGVYRPGSPFLSLVKYLQRNSGDKPLAWR